MPRSATQPETEQGDGMMVPSSSSETAAGDFTSTKHSIRVVAERESAVAVDDEDDMVLCHGDPHVYSLHEINDFLDVTYGRHTAQVRVFFPNIDKFIQSVIRIRKRVAYEGLTKQKRFRLKKLLTKLTKEKRGKDFIPLQNKIKMKVMSHAQWVISLLYCSLITRCSSHHNECSENCDP